MLMGHQNFFFMPHFECRDESALFAFVIIGAVVLVAVTLWWSYKTISERIERHKRSVGVKEFIVTDYTRGIADI
jgi:Na+/melibiose symporter-like transporter